ncbi:MAG: 2Fe-2S iron-sulfur cluster binding domain-containing protein [Euryarchaeota archaeon]|jgi:ferredoxin|nr:2Fe-2S iron-sulfur cluster binding domain-containing protein [Euryarchaeota archaeon]
MALLRFFRNGVIVGSAENQEGVPILDIAEDAGIDIPRGCSSGTCGTCLIKLLSGSVPMPVPLPPGLDDDLVAEGCILGCIGIAEGACDIEINPPL